MDVQQRRDGVAGRVTLVPRGHIDLATAPRLAEAMAAARGDGVTEVVVDLAGVDFLDSAGIRVLVQAARETAEADAHLYVCGAAGWVARVLDITGVSGYLKPPPERASADAVEPGE